MSAAAWIAGAGAAAVVVAPMSIVLLFSPGSAAACDTGGAPPHEGAYSQQDMQALWMSQHGDPDRALIASAVAMAESSGNPDASSANPAGGLNLGLWQVWDGNAGATLDPAGNARAAIRLSRDGTDWRLWETHANGDYLRFMGTPSPSGQPFDGPVSGCDGSPDGPVEGTPRHIIDSIVLAIARRDGIARTAAQNDAANAAHGPTESGGRSDHQGPPDVAWAADMSNGVTTPEEDKLARDLAERFGLAPLNLRTTGASGSMQQSSRTVGGYRFQLIYRSHLGGDHDNHVHLGVRVAR